MNDTSNPNLQHARRLHDQASRWLIRLEADDCSAQERKEFERWLDADEAHRQALQDMAALWDQLDSVAQFQSQRPAQHRNRPAIKIKRRRTTVWAAAAIILICVWSYPYLAIRLHADFVTGIGQARQITLADGSMVNLNTGSALRVNYSEGVREVELLQGEAFFQVRSNKIRPFRVIAGKTQATALGTAYVVRNDSQEGAVIVTKGRVEVRQQGGRHPEQRVKVSAGQAVEFSDAALADSAHPASLERATAWLRGQILFDGEPLGQVVAELNRYYPGRIVIIGDEFKHRRVTGVFSTGDPAHIARSLAATFNLDVTQLGDYLLLLHRS